MGIIGFDGIDQVIALAETEDAAALRAEVTAPLVVGKVAALIEANAKVIAPVDTGALRGSIGTGPSDGGLTADIGSDLSYAGYVEYGTSRQAPAAYLGPSLDRYGGTFVEAMGQIGGLP